MAHAVLPVAGGRSAGTRVLAVLDGSNEFADAALTAADLMASTPGAQFTVLAPSEVASPDSAPSPAGGGLVTLSGATSSLMKTIRLIEGRGFRTSLRTTEGSLLAEAGRVSDSHDLVVLPRSLARFAEEFAVPVIVAP